jgi:hypothetical protein
MRQTWARNVEAAALLLEPQKMSDRRAPPQVRALLRAPLMRPPVYRGTVNVTLTAQCSKRNVPGTGMSQRTSVHIRQTFRLSVLMSH